MIKSIARACSLFSIFPIYLTYRVHLLISSDRSCFPAYSQFLAQFPGKLGSYMRVSFYSLTLESCPSNCFIGYGTIFSTAQVAIKDKVYLGNYCVIGNVQIGESTMIASRVSLLSGLNQHGRELGNVPYQEQLGVFERVNIGHNCWIGEGAIVGANVGSNTIVGAGAVVLKELPENITAIGNPAKMISRQE